MTASAASAGSDSVNRSSRNPRADQQGMPYDVDSTIDAELRNGGVMP